MHCGPGNFLKCHHAPATPYSDRLKKSLGTTEDRGTTSQNVSQSTDDLPRKSVCSLSSYVAAQRCQPCVRLHRSMSSDLRHLGKSTVAHVEAAPILGRACLSQMKWHRMNRRSRHRDLEGNMAFSHRLIRLALRIASPDQLDQRASMHFRNAP